MVPKAGSDGTNTWLVVSVAAGGTTGSFHGGFAGSEKGVQPDRLGKGIGQFL
jgi:hypothetical protein